MYRAKRLSKKTFYRHKNTKREALIELNEGS